MKKAFIHIGTGKTGSTAIQRSLARSQECGSLGEIAYPLVSSLPDSYNQNFVSIFYKTFDRLERANKATIKFNSKDYLKLKNRLLGGYLSSLDSSERIIISAEYLSTYTKDEIKKFKLDLVERGFEDFRILIFVREPSSYYISFLQQRLKASHVLISPESFRYNFKESIQNWMSHFDKVEVIPYTRELVINNGLLNRLEEKLGDFFDREISLSVVNHKNTSLPLEALCLLRSYRQYFYSNSPDLFQKDSSFLLAILKSIDQNVFTPLQLKDDCRSIISKNHIKELQWLKEEFGIKLDGRALSPVKPFIWDSNSSLQDIFKDHYSKNEKFHNEVIRKLLDIGITLKKEVFRQSKDLTKYSIESSNFKDKIQSIESTNNKLEMEISYLKGEITEKNMEIRRHVSQYNHIPGFILRALKIFKRFQ